MFFGLALRIPGMSYLNSLWTPATALEGSDPSLWLRADQGVYTGGARQFYLADKGALNIASNAALNMGTSDVSVGVWAYVESVAGTHVLFSKIAGNVGIRGYLAGSSLVIDLYAADSTRVFKVHSSTISTGQWYLFLFEYDRDGNATVSINNANAETVSIAAHSASNVTNSASFSLGGDVEGNQFYYSGREARVFYTKRLLTTAEKTWLYNQGNGRVYGELGVAGTDGSALLTSLSAYWNLNETGGTDNAIDAHSTNDLTPTFAELLGNTGFETAGGGGADVFGSWTEFTGGTGVVADEGTVVDAGAHALSLTSDGGANYAIVRQTIATAGHRYTYSLRARYLASGNASIYIGSSNQITLTLTGSYATYSGTTTALTDGIVQLSKDEASSTGYFDTVSVKAVDIPAADGPATDIASDSIGSNHGQLVNFADSETAWSSDIPSALPAGGFSLAFNGTNDYVNLSSAITTGTTFTLSCWLKSSGVNPFQDIFTVSVNGNGLYNSGSSQLDYFYSGSSHLSSVGINSGQWNHVGLSVSAGAGTFYINGVAAGTCSSVPSLALKTIGYLNPSNIDDLRVYSVAKDAAAMLALSNGTDDQTSIVARYPFDDGLQSSLVDGDPVVMFESFEGARYQFLQATAAKRMLYVASAQNSKPGIAPDNVDDLLRLSGTLTTETDGTLILVFKTGATAFSADHTLLASSDEASTNNYLQVGIDSAGKCFIETNVAGTVHRVTGDTVLSTSTAYSLVIASSGTAWTMRVSGVAQTLTVTTSNSGNWFGDVSGRDNVTLAALKHTSEVEFSQATYLLGLLYPINLSAASIAKVSAYTTTQFSVAS